MVLNNIMQFVGMSGVTIIVAAEFLGARFPRFVYFVTGVVFGAVAMDLTREYLL